MIRFAHLHEIFFPQLPSRDVALGFVRVSHEAWAPESSLLRPRQANQKLILILSGEGVYDGDRTQPLRGGDLCVSAPGRDRQIRTAAEAPLEFLLLALTGRDRETVVEQVLGFRDGVVRLRDPLAIQEVFDRFFAEAADIHPNTSIICGHYLHILLQKVVINLGAGAETSRARETFSRCHRHMQENFDKMRSPGDVARACFVDPAYMSRLYQRFAGTTPREHLGRLKFNKAIHLLTTTNRSVKDIAAALNFRDPFTFSRAFKRCIGVSPQQYRKQGQ